MVKEAIYEGTGTHKRFFLFFVKYVRHKRIFFFVKYVRHKHIFFFVKYVRKDMVKEAISEGRGIIMRKLNRLYLRPYKSGHRGTL